MKERVKKKVSKKDFLWWGLRVSLFGLVGFVVLFWVLWSYTTSDYSILLFYFIIPLFALSSIVFSIINLVKKKNKLFSIVALIISIIVFLFVAVGFMI